MRHSGISGVSKWVTRFAGLFLAAVPTWGAGPSLVFSKVFGGSAADTVAAIATDFQGNVVLAGLTTSADFPVTNGATNHSLQFASTIDGGLTWQPLGSLPAGYATTLAVDFANPTIWYAGGSTGLFRSIDAGGTWQPLPLTLPACSYNTDPNFFDPRYCGITGLAIVHAPLPRRGVAGPARSTTIYAATPAGIMKSNDSGQTWLAAAPLSKQVTIPTAFIDYLAVDPFDDDSIFTAALGTDFRSSDGGLTWVSFSPGTAAAATINEGVAHRVAFDPFVRGLMYLVDHGSLYRSVNGGAGWVPVSAPFHSAVSIWPDPTSPGVLYALNNNGTTGIYRTTDRGTTWALLASGSVPAADFLAVDPAQPSIVVTNSVRTGDGGHSWSPLLLSSPPLALTPSPSEIVFDPGNPGHAIAVMVTPGARTAFLTKLDSQGRILFSTYFGGQSITAIAGAATDPSGNIYLAGSATAADFPATAGAYRTTLPASGQASFVAKLDPAGNLIYATYLDDFDDAKAIAVDPGGNAVVGGQRQTSTSSSCFATKLTADGSAEIFFTQLAGATGNFCTTVAADASGNTILGGSSTPGFPVTAGALQTSPGGGSQDGTFAKLDPRGNVMFASYLGGSDRDEVDAVATDAAGNIYVLGTTASKDFPVTSGVYQQSLSANCAYPSSSFDTGLIGTITEYRMDDFFITKLDSSGKLIFSTYLGGVCLDQALSLAVDGAGNVWVAGLSDSDPFPQVLPLESGPAVEYYEATISELDPSGGILKFSSYLQAGSAPVLAVDPAGNAYLAGSNVPPPSPYGGLPQPPPVVLQQVFLAKIGQ